MELGLKGKVIAITGGSEGIGGAAAMRLAQEGVKLAICARRADVMEAAAENIRNKTGAEVMTMVADVTKPDDMPRFIEETVKRYGRIDALVNNAGATGQSPFDAVDDKAWQHDLDIKVFAHIRTVRAAIPHMKKQGGGRIINLNMVGAKQPAAGTFPTTTTRAAGLALTKALSKELAPFNILVNAVRWARSRACSRSAARSASTSRWTSTTPRPARPCRWVAWASRRKWRTSSRSSLRMRRAT